MDKIEELLTRGVDKIYPSRKELEKVLRSGKKLRVYQGFDPTGAKLHIGHMVGFRKLAQWQDFGHHVIFLIGDGTGQAGDPSGRTKARARFLTQEELRKNAKDYVMQARKIVQFDGKNPVEILYNGDWLNKLTLADILDIAGHFTLAQLSERDLFQERAKRGEEVNLREFLYPILQAYDSVAMNIDVEIGGTDQTFNMLAGRTLVREIQHREKFVMTTPLLTDSKGQKIGKTEGNAIALTDKPEDLFGKIMSLPDDVIVKGLEYLTDMPMDKIRSIEKAIQEGKNPMQYKMRLAYEIVKQLNTAEKAREAQDQFEKLTQQKEIPETLQTITLTSGTTLVDAVVGLGFVRSRSEAKRVVHQGGTLVQNQVVTDPSFKLPSGESLIRVGTRKFGKVKIQ